MKVIEKIRSSINAMKQSYADYRHKLEQNPRSAIRLKNYDILLYILIVFVCTRLVIYLFGVMVYATDNETLNFTLENVFNHWDVGNYITIAKNGYVNTGNDRFLICFYPLFPMLLKGVTYIVKSHFAAGLIISNLSFFAACFFLYKLVLLDFEEKIAKHTVFFMMMFPFSFFLAVGYTEALFLFVSIATLYFVRTRRYFTAGIMGYFTTFARNQGVLILIPIAVEFLLSIDIMSKLKKKEYKKIVSDIFTYGIFLTLIPLGFGTYLVINKMVSGKWFVFVEYQKTCYQHNFVFFISNLGDIMKNAFFNSSIRVVDRITIWMPQFIGFFFTVFFIVYGFFKKIRFSYILYMIFTLTISYSASFLLAGVRYLVPIFPLYLSLAIFAKNDKRFFTLSYTLCLLQAFFLLGFVKYWPIL